MIEGSLELKYVDSLKRGMSVAFDGKGGPTSALQAAHIPKWPIVTLGRNVQSEIVKKSLVSSHRELAKAVKSTA
jgi:hypothetical protein